MLVFYGKIQLDKSDILAKFTVYGIFINISGLV